MNFGSQAGRLGIGIIGMGHVGPVIGSALRAAGHTIVGVSASSERSRERADDMLPGVPILSVEDLVERSEVVILAIPDDAIEGLVQGLAQMGRWQTGQLLIHLSGAHGVGILSAATAQGVIPLAIHPAMTFTGTSIDVARLVGTPCAVTAPPLVLPIAQALVVEMGGEPVEVLEENRALYHVGLAYGSNFLNAIVLQSLEILRVAGIEDPGTFVTPLLSAALDRSLRQGVTAISGPVSRGDAGTIDTHLTVLHALSEPHAANASDTYIHMTGQLIALLQQAGKLPEHIAADLKAVLKKHQ